MSANVFEAIGADDALINAISENRALNSSDRFVAMLVAWRRAIDTQPLPVVSLDDACAAARRGAETAAERSGVTDPHTRPCPAAGGVLRAQHDPPVDVPSPQSGATGPCPGRPGGVTPPEGDPMLDSATGPIERVRVVLNQPGRDRRVDGHAAYREWINSPLEDDEPQRMSMLGVAFWLSVALTVVYVAVVWAVIA